MIGTDITPQQIESLIFIFLRVSACIVSLPVIGNNNIPVKVKGGLSLLIAFLIFPVIRYEPVPLDIVPLSLKMAGEVIIGIMIGLMGRLLFSGIQLAGQLIGFQMGFAIVNVVDPVSSTQVSIISEFQYLLAMLIFFAVNGHHIFLYAIAESYKIIPPLDFHFSASLMEYLIDYSRDLFVVAIKTGAPIIGLLLLTSVSLGLIARTVPQMNIFIVGFPLKIALGLIAIGISLPLFVKTVSMIFLHAGDNLKILMNLM